MLVTKQDRGNTWWVLEHDPRFSGQRSSCSLFCESWHVTSLPLVKSWNRDVWKQSLHTLGNKLFSFLCSYFGTKTVGHLNHLVNFSCWRLCAFPALWKQYLRSCSFDLIQIQGCASLLCSAALNKSTLMRGPGYSAGSRRSIALIFVKVMLPHSHTPAWLVQTSCYPNTHAYVQKKKKKVTDYYSRYGIRTP